MPTINDFAQAIRSKLDQLVRKDAQVWNAMDHGAVGDGVANDTAALQALADAIASAGGGTLLLPAGRDFAVTQLRLGTGLTLDFTGATLRRRGAAAGGSGGATLRNADQVNGNSRIRIRGGRIIANSDTDQGKHVAFLGVQGLEIDRLQVERAHGDWAFFARDCDDMTIGHISTIGGYSIYEDGVHLEGCQRVTIGTILAESGDDCFAVVQTTATTRVARSIAVGTIVARSRLANAVKLEVDPGAPGISDVSIGHLVADKSTANAGNCIHILDETGTRSIAHVSIGSAQIDASASTGHGVLVKSAQDVTLSGLHLRSPQGVGIDVENVARLHMVGCSVRGTRGSSVPGIRLRGLTDFEMVGCVVEAATSHAFELGSSSMPVSDGVVQGCTARSSTGNGFQLHAASRVTVSGNRVRACSWAIREEGTSGANLISGNDVRGNILAISAAAGDGNGTFRDGNVGGGRLHAFASGDTTPSVAGGNRAWSTANASATTITALDDGQPGQVVTIVTTDAQTTFAHSPALRLQGAVNWTAPANATLTLIRTASAWVEVARTAT